MKSRIIAAILAFFFGGIALNEFYTKNTKTAIIELVLSVLLCWIGAPIVIAIINAVKGCMYLWCDTDEEFIKKHCKITE